MKPAITAPIDDDPMPPGRGRRLGVLVIVLIVVVVAAWSEWNRIAWRRFQAEMVRVHAAGEPDWETDLERPPVPDSQNAALYLRRAAAEVVETPEQNAHAKDNFFQVPLGPDAIEAMGRVLDANRLALADIRRAATLPNLYWGQRKINPSDPNSGMLYNDDFRSMRWLADPLTFAIRHAHATGDDRAALGYVIDLLAVARSVDTRDDIIAFLTAEGIVTTATDEVGSLAADLRVGEGAGNARRAEVNEMIAQLLDTGIRRQGLLRAIEYECSEAAVPATARFTVQFRHVEIESHDRIVAAPVGLDATADRIARPFFLFGAAHNLQYLAQFADAIRAPDTAALPQTHQPPPRKDFHVSEMFGVHWVFSQSVPALNLSGMFRAHRKISSKNAELGALTLATRLYQIDHDGQMPPTTFALIPRYLPALPAGTTLPTVPTFAPALKTRSAATPSPTTVPVVTQPGTN